MKKLSIIMPCFNCIDTLEEAVNSIITQEFSFPFEVVMVDDHSSDGTKELIQSLSNDFAQIKAVFHSENKGGGAARNTAVANSTGDIIFCLDGDDILGANCLSKMFNFLVNNPHLDGVTFKERRYFYGNNQNNIDTISFSNGDIGIEQFFGKRENPLIANFMYTRNSFDISGGYPEYHGFDTQGFGFRWLSKGFIAEVVEGTYYLHRQRPIGKKSYFEREFSEGKVSINQIYILEEIIYLFKPDVQKFIVSFDPKRFLDLDESPFLFLKNKNLEENIFKENINSFLKQGVDNILVKDSVFYYWNGVKEYWRENYLAAIENLVTARKEFDGVQLDHYIVDSLLRHSGEKDSIEFFLNRLSSFVSVDTKGVVGTRQSFYRRGKNKIRKLWNRV